MRTNNAGAVKTAIMRGRSLDDDGWLGWATLLLLGSVLVYGLLCVPAHAETLQPPSRIANIYAGFDHQPTRSEIEGRERSAKIAPNTGHQSSEDATLQQLYQQLRERAGAG
jgi:hypothetical protein